MIVLSLKNFAILLGISLVLNSILCYVIRNRERNDSLVWILIFSFIPFVNIFLSIFLITYSIKIIKDRIVRKKSLWYFEVEND